LQTLRGGCEKCPTLSRLRSNKSNLRVRCGHFEPECICVLRAYPRAGRRIFVLVTARRFPPSWSVEEQARVLCRLGDEAQGLQGAADHLRTLAASPGNQCVRLMRGTNAARTGAERPSGATPSRPLSGSLTGPTEEYPRTWNDVSTVHRDCRSVKKGIRQFVLTGTSELDR
jgi:hypothetical protein